MCLVYPPQPFWCNCTYATTNPLPCKEVTGGDTTDVSEIRDEHGKEKVGLTIHSFPQSCGVNAKPANIEVQNKEQLLLLFVGSWLVDNK